MSRCYYKTLEVPEDAPLEEIKKNFRRLSMEHHPDTAQGGCQKTNAQKFSEISEAYETLSNTKERRRYDLQKQDRFWYQNINRDGRAHSHGPYADMRPPPQGPKAEGFYRVFETVIRPRNIMIGITVGMGTMMAYNAMFGEDRRKKLLEYKQGKQMVEAWKNPKTGRWEQAAPWDPTYQRLRPTLQLVPRDQVITRTRG